MCKNQEIQSFAFMDIETTNLPEYNFGKVNILEISIYACLRRDIISSKNGEIPRTTHKLTLYFNPFMQINPDASKLCDLYNDMLEPENKFNENAGNVIINFLQHLQKPVCLVAHNGFNFDFPILKKSLERVNINIPDFILCTDSYLAIKSIDEAKELEENQQQRQQQELNNINNENDFEIEELLFNDFKETENTKIKSNDDFDNVEGSFKKFENINEKYEIDSRQKLNETTPKTKRTAINNVGCNKRKFINNNEKIIQLDETDDGNLKVKNEFKSKRKLDFSKASNVSSSTSISSSASTSTSTSTSSTSTPKKFKPKGYYELPTIFKRLFGKSPDVLHYAEDDVRSLQQIFISPRRHEFLKYADENAIKFIDVPLKNIR